MHGDAVPSVAAGDHVVALTPSALAACSARGLEASVLDDHVARKSILAAEVSHLRWEIGWLNRLDEAAGGGGGTRAGATYIVQPLDAVVLAGWLLRALVVAISPSRLVYIGPTLGSAPDPVMFHSGHLQFSPRHGDAPLASRLLPLLARQLDLPYAEVSTPGASGAGPHPAVRSGRQRVVARLAAARNTLPLVSANLRGHGQPAAGTTLMCWSTAYGARSFIVDQGQRAQHVLFLRRGMPSTALLAPSVRGLRRCSTAVPVVPNEVDQALSPEAETLLDEADRRIGVDGAAQMAASRLAFFLGAIVPVIERAAALLRPELERHGVTMVAAANPSSIEEFAALLAARQAGVPATLYQHGDHLLPYDTWFSTELQSFDRLAASDASLVDDLPEAADRLGAWCPAVVMSSPRVEQLRRRRRPAPPSAPTCFLPMFFLADAAQVGGHAVDDAWAHRWHLRLLALMAEHTEVQFIWKGLPSVDYVPDPLAELLRRKPVPNVRYDARPFQAVLPEVGRVICEFPSTGLYEAVHVGRPVLPLVFSRFVTVRSRGAELFRPALRACADADGALREVEEFLSADPISYVVDPSPIYPGRPGSEVGAPR